MFLFQENEIILEVGATSRQDGSTLFLAAHGPEFHTIDIDPDVIGELSVYTNITAWLGDAVYVLKTWKHTHFIPRIGFAWLDGWDWPYEVLEGPTLDAYRQVYGKRGQELTEKESARSHLESAKLIFPLMASDGLIVIDDTWYDDTLTWHGKGETAIPWLLKQRCQLMDATGPARVVTNGFTCVKVER